MAWKRPMPSRAKAWKRQASAIAREVVRVLTEDGIGIDTEEHMTKIIGGVVYTAACKVLRAPAPAPRRMTPLQRRPKKEGT